MLSGNLLKNNKVIRICMGSFCDFASKRHYDHAGHGKEVQKWVVVLFI